MTANAASRPVKGKKAPQIIWVTIDRFFPGNEASGVYQSKAAAVRSLNSDETLHKYVNADRPVNTKVRSKAKR